MKTFAVHVINPQGRDLFEKLGVTKDRLLEIRRKLENYSEIIQDEGPTCLSEFVGDYTKDLKNANEFFVATYIMGYARGIAEAVSEDLFVK